MSQYRRRILLINKPFQLKFSFFVVSWLFALSVIYPSLIWQIFEAFTKYLMLDPKGPGSAVIQKSRDDLLFWLIFMQGFLMLLTFSISIFISHRIAGPLFKLRRGLSDLRDGKLEPITFRRFDHFGELASEYNQTVSSVKDAITATQKHLETALQKTNDTAVKKEIENSIKTLSHFKTQKSD